MVICQLCDRKFENEHGLSVHLARAHDVHGSRGRLSLNVIHRFFPSLKKRKWTKAERFLNKAVDGDVHDVWIRGYAQALRGMIITLRMDHTSPEPFILKLKRYYEEPLQEVKKEFLKLSRRSLNTEFDEGYFRAWADYTHYLLHRGVRKKNRDTT